MFLSLIKYPTGSGGDAGAAVWGSITGSISAQSDLVSALGLKAPIASPAFTGPIITTKNVNDAVSSLLVNNVQGTGKILSLQNNGFDRLTVSMTGVVDSLSGYQIGGQDSIIPNGVNLEIAGGGGFTGITLMKKVGIGVTPGTARITLPGVTNALTDGIDFGGGNGLYKDATNRIVFTGNSYIPGVYTASIFQLSGSGNGSIDMPTTGVRIYANKSNTDPTLIVNNVHASSTGDILRLTNSAGTVFNVSKAGIVQFNTYTTGFIKSDGSGVISSGTVGQADVTNLVSDLNLKQNHLATKSIGFYLPNGAGAVTFAVGGMVTTPVGGSASTARIPASTNMFTMGRRLGQTSVATAAGCAGLRSSSLAYWRGNASGLGGFLYKARFGMADAATVAGRKAFIGFYANTNNATSDPSALVNTIFMAFDPGQTTWRIMSNNGTTTTQVNLGANFPCNTDSVDIYDLTLYAAPNSSTVDYTVLRVNTGDTTSGTIINANLPAATTLLGEHLQTCNGATALAVTVDIWWKYIETVN